MEEKAFPANWYDQSIRVDPLQRFWHRRRFAEVSHIITPAGGKVLDIGCNDGTFSKVIFEKTKARKLIGIDTDFKSITWANKHKGGKAIEFLVGDASRLNFRNDSFEAVFCLEVLEHVKDPLKVLKEIRRVMKSSGYGVLLVPSDSFLFRLVWFLWLKFYPRGWVWRGTHIQSFRNNYLPRLCQEAGFKIEINKKFNLGMLHLVKVRKT